MIGDIYTERHQKRFEKAIASFSGKFMNDTKWLKLFQAISNHSSLVAKCQVKNIGDEFIRILEIPSKEDFEETFHKKGIKDVPAGPAKFKEIEFIKFPTQWENGKNISHQDIEAISDFISLIAQFETRQYTNSLWPSLKNYPRPSLYWLLLS
jgi:hypothetical protein